MIASIMPTLAPHRQRLPLISSLTSSRVRAPFLQHPDGTADLPGSTVSALKGIVIDERLLQGMQHITVGNTFDRCDRCAVFHHRQRQTAEDALTVTQQCTGTALAMVTTLFCTGQLEIFPYSVQQRYPWMNVDLVAPLVDVQCNDWHSVPGRKNPAGERQSGWRTKWRYNWTDGCKAP